MGSNRIGRGLAVFALIWAALWAERWSLARASEGAAECVPWYGLQRDEVLTWHGDPTVAATASRGCEAAALPEPGEILHIQRLGGTCRAVLRPMSARHRLRLGLGLNVNTASVQALEAVSGIGPATARAIVAGRPYATLLALERVRGIGPARRERFARWLTVTAPRLPSPLWPSCRPRGASARRTP